MMNKKAQYAALPYAAFAAIFIAAPIILIAFYSFCSDAGNGVSLTLENFGKFFDFSNPVYLQVLWRSIYLALISTAICLLLGYPMAYILSRMKPNVRTVVSVLFVLPMWMNFLLRTYAWMSLLEKNGLINSLLGALGLPAQHLMYTQGAVVLGNVYNFLPFMILPIYNVLIKIDPSVIEAAEDLGANGFQVLRRVILPLSKGGIANGITMTLMPAVTTFVISKLLGGGQTALIGDLIENQFKTTGNWGFGSAMSVIIMVMILLTMNIGGKDSEGGLLF